MRYRRNWDGMDEVIPTEVMDGNTIRVIETEPEQRTRNVIIHAENFSPRPVNDCTERQRASERDRRRKEVEMIRLTLQAVLLMAIFIMICFIDTTGLFGTAVLMVMIIGFSGLIILLENKNEH